MAYSLRFIDYVNFYLLTCQFGKAIIYNFVNKKTNQYRGRVYGYIRLGRAGIEAFRSSAIFAFENLKLSSF